MAILVAFRHVTPSYRAYRRPSGTAGRRWQGSSGSLRDAFRASGEGVRRLACWDWRKGCEDRLWRGKSRRWLRQMAVGRDSSRLRLAAQGRGRRSEINDAVVLHGECGTSSQAHSCRITRGCSFSTVWRFSHDRRDIRVPGLRARQNRVALHEADTNGRVDLGLACLNLVVANSNKPQRMSLPLLSVSEPGSRAHQAIAGPKRRLACWMKALLDVIHAKLQVTNRLRFSPATVARICQQATGGRP